jgi:hypothetical protein
MHKSWPTIPGGWSRLGWPACTKMHKRAQPKKAPGSASEEIKRLVQRHGRAQPGALAFRMPPAFPVIINLVILRCTLALILCLAACNRSNVDKEAVRQGIVDHVSKAGLNMGAMELTVGSVEFNGDKANATVSFAAKGSPASAGMSIQYQLERQAGKWVVVGRKDAGGSPHGGGAMPGGANPHGGMAPPAGGGPASMPSPRDLPPTGKPK